MRFIRGLTIAFMAVALIMLPVAGLSSFFAIFTFGGDRLADWSIGAFSCSLVVLWQGWTTLNSGKARWWELALLAVLTLPSAALVVMLIRDY